MYSPYMPFFTSQQPRSINSGYRHDQTIYGDNVNLMSRAGNRTQPGMKHPYHLSNNSSLPPIPPAGHCGSNNGLMYDFTAAAAAAAAAAASVNMSAGNDMSYNNLDIDRGVKRRRRLTQEETNLLNDIFERTSKPNALVRKMLAERLNMSPRTVQIWFQNRRAKVKKDGKGNSSVNGNDSSPSTSGDSPNSKSLSDSGPSLSRSTSTSSATTDTAYKLGSQEKESFTPSLRTDSIMSNLSDWSTDCDWTFPTMDYSSPNNPMYIPTKESPANPTSVSDDTESDTTGTTASSRQPWPIEFPLVSSKSENYLGIHHVRTTEDAPTNKCKQEDLAFNAPLATPAVANTSISNVNNPSADWFPDCNDPNYLLDQNCLPLLFQSLQGLGEIQGNVDLFK